MIYLVGREDDERLHVVEANTPKEAFDSHVHEWGIDYPESLVAFAARKCLPVVNVKLAIQQHEEENPEDSPLFDCWEARDKDGKIQELQTIVNKFIEANFKPFYMAEDVVYRHAPEVTP